MVSERSRTLVREHGLFQNFTHARTQPCQQQATLNHSNVRNFGQYRLPRVRDPEQDAQASRRLVKSLFKYFLLLAVDIKQNTWAMCYLFKILARKCTPHASDSTVDKYTRSRLFQPLVGNYLLRTLDFNTNTHALRYLYNF